jgi:ParB family chromosome partitioning protein
MFKNIAIDLLVPHPQNCNRMDEDTLRKLRRHIGRNGRYEPLTARPHPQEDGKYQVLNGHHRLRVLRALGHREATCTVWHMDDDQARLYLATLNRLAGTDVPERRAMLLEDLLAHFDLDELSGLLPEVDEQLEELRRLSRLEIDDLPVRANEAPDVPAPVLLDFVLDVTQAKDVNLALDAVVSAEDGRISRGEALVRVARCFLKRQCGAAKGDGA